MKADKHFHKGFGTMEKAYNDFATFSQDNIDAFVRANAAITRGFEQLSKNYVALATRSIEEAVETGKRLASCKSITEAFDLQTRFAQETIENFVAEAKKVQDLSANLMKDASAPIAERFKATVATGTAAAQATATAATAAVNTPVRTTKQAA